MNTNIILKQMVRKISKYNRDSFRKILHVDIQNCEPINVKGQKYDSKTQGKNIFCFLDKNFRLLLITEGSKPIEKCKDNLYIENYFNRTPLNRKNIEPKSEYILMITPEMKKQYKPHKLISYGRSDTAKESLRKRLKEYKNKKNQIYSHDQIKEIITNIMGFLTVNIFEDKEYVNTNFKNLSLFDRTMPRVISNFSDIVNNYLYNYNEYQKEIIRYNQLKNDGNDLDNWDPKYSFSYKNYLQYKNEILNWKIIIENIQNQQEII